MTTRGYTIDRRPQSAGGGWRVRLIEDGLEVGGGVFPEDYEDVESDPYQDAVEMASMWMEGR